MSHFDSLGGERRRPATFVDIVLQIVIVLAVVAIWSAALTGFIRIVGLDWPVWLGEQAGPEVADVTTTPTTLQATQTPQGVQITRTPGLSPAAGTPGTSPASTPVTRVTTTTTPQTTRTPQGVQITRTPGLTPVTGTPGTSPASPAAVTGTPTAQATGTPQQITRTPGLTPVTGPAAGTMGLTPAAATPGPATVTPGSGDTAETTTASYAAVKPIFDRRCVKCHGGRRTAEGLDMRTHDALMLGSDNGEVVVPGNAGDSVLVKVIEDGEMPKNEPHLTPVEVNLIIKWVEAGAANG